MKLRSTTKAKLKKPPRICANCGDTATWIEKRYIGPMRRLTPERYPKCGACFDAIYKPRWEAARIK